MQLPALFSAALLVAATGVKAHTTFQYINDASAPIRPPPNNNPIQNVASTDLACNVNGAVPVSSKLSVAAGSTVTLEWHHEGRTSEAIDSSHLGPVITYLAKVPDATTATSPSSLGWFKIFQDGLTVSGSTQTWGVTKLIANGGKYTSKIPASIASGDYLLRSEIIALHSAGSSGGAQFYVGCAQITVTGGGSASPATVKLPGAYSASDPGILISIYYPVLTSYTVPGPAVFTG
ncbi:glycoside hydrolase family 61 protein [Geopyxis carbonaria]|nr:glycoside hydrolase family 61 protein [Geopyxis carbonaria]